MDAFSQFLTSDLSLWGLFLSSLLAATILPGGSEAVLYGVLQLHPDLTWPSLLIATMGNTLGGAITFWMGWALPHHPVACPPAAHTPKIQYLDTLRRYGTPLLLLSWVPLIGDALCLAAGWLRLNIGQAVLFLAIGKFARYAALIYMIS